MRHTVLHYPCLNEVGIHIFVCMCVCLHVCMGRHMYTCMCAYACRSHGLAVDILFSYSTFTCSDRSDTTSEAHWISKAGWPLSPRTSLSHLPSTGISAELCCTKLCTWVLGSELRWLPLHLFCSASPLPIGLSLLPGHLSLLPYSFFEFRQIDLKAHDKKKKVFMLKFL